ncbi:sigma-70 family RNA polymerase sigma factor [Paenibacillus sp. IHBB 10380]|uniref:sigma-70 family RNA polymerase sigma factor n=1 Tax=Paenibacillus sp. IHBB 10380 TaxID=1566358 RepID=UPI0005CFE353|nr:sigma-70 family RNA polymerase sigma factor [Paenibacillus sp. IHBB 10380]AJS57879.1 RNA polymerase [Paenibacillus sp. IHBB 10380]
MSNKQDVRKARNGDHEAFIRLITEMKLPLYRMAHSILKSDEDCADAIQETILKAYKAVHTLQKPDYFQSWLFRILINECNRLLAKHLKLGEVEAIERLSYIEPGYGNIDIREVVNDLDESLRIVVILHYFHDMTMKQISDILDLTEGAVKTRMHRARKQLLEWLSNLETKEHEA